MSTDAPTRLSPETIGRAPFSRTGAVFLALVAAGITFLLVAGGKLLWGYFRPMPAASPFAEQIAQKIVTIALDVGGLLSIARIAPAIQSAPTTRFRSLNAQKNAYGITTTGLAIYPMHLVSMFVLDNFKWGGWASTLLTVPQLIGTGVLFLVARLPVDAVAERPVVTPRPLGSRPTRPFVSDLQFRESLDVTDSSGPLWVRLASGRPRRLRLLNLVMFIAIALVTFFAAPSLRELLDPSTVSRNSTAALGYKLVLCVLGAATAALAVNTALALRRQSVDSGRLAVISAALGSAFAALLAGQIWSDSKASESFVSRLVPLLSVASITLFIRVKLWRLAWHLSHVPANTTTRSASVTESRINFRFAEATKIFAVLTGLVVVFVVTLILAFRDLNPELVVPWRYRFDVKLLLSVTGLWALVSNTMALVHAPASVFGKRMSDWYYQLLPLFMIPTFVARAWLVPDAKDLPYDWLLMSFGGLIASAEVGKRWAVKSTAGRPIGPKSSRPAQPSAVHMLRILAILVMSVPYLGLDVGPARYFIAMIVGAVSYAYITYARAGDRDRTVRADLRVIADVASCMGAFYLFAMTGVGGLKALPQAIVVAVLFVVAVWISLIAYVAALRREGVFEDNSKPTKKRRR
jgi:hypothetical protein